MTTLSAERRSQTAEHLLSSLVASVGRAAEKRGVRNEKDLDKIVGDLRKQSFQTRHRDAFFARVYALVRRIPRGRVATYGQIARALGMPRGARTVGWAMRAGDEKIPWHRVVNARGGISVRPTPGYREQRARLRAEGIRFGRAGKVDLKKYGWRKV